MCQMRNRFVLLLLCAFAALPCLSQTSVVPVRIDPSGDNTTVQLMPLDSATEAQHPRLFFTPADQAMRPFALLLKNNWSQPIVAISLIWTITTPQGPRTFESHMQAMAGGVVASAGPMFFPPPAATERRLPPSSQAPDTTEAQTSQGGLQSKARYRIPNMPMRSWAGLNRELAPGKSLLVTPGSFRYLEGTGVGSGSYSEILSDATEGSVLVDAVALADGTVTGPDSSHTLDALNAHNVAVEAFATAMRSARQNGQDPIATLNELAKQFPDSQDPIAKAEGNIARLMLHSPNWEKQLQTVESVQLVTYHR